MIMKSLLAYGNFFEFGYPSLIAGFNYDAISGSCGNFLIWIMFNALNGLFVCMMMLYFLLK